MRSRRPAYEGSGGVVTEIKQVRRDCKWRI